VPTDESHQAGARGDGRDRDETGTGSSPVAADAPGRDRPDGDHDTEQDRDSADAADTAAASALARAREAARAKGLHPGSKPPRKRDQSGGRAGSGAGGRDGRDGRDPSLLGDQLDRLLLDRGWNVDVAVGSVMGRWPAIVGTEVAAHCRPVTFSDGVLIVRADSTAWATQLRMMSSSILGRLETEVGKDAVTELRVQGPSAPSWTRGPRKSTGPGPRDTYG